MRFPGEVTEPELLLQHVFDVNVLASREESLPLSLLEAAACGCPTVCTAVGGNGEIVVDGETGLQVPKDDPRALATALLRLAKDRALRERLGHAARARAEKRFGLDAFVAGVERALIDVLPAARRNG